MMIKKYKVPRESDRILETQFRISSSAELYKMVCEPDETDLDIHIPAVMLPQDAGASLEKMLMNSSSGKLFHMAKFEPSKIVKFSLNFILLSF